MGDRDNNRIPVATSTIIYDALLESAEKQIRRKDVNLRSVDDVRNTGLIDNLDPFLLIHK